jgi:ribosomal protein S18 acetylase RimI-like enzyme
MANIRLIEVTVGDSVLDEVERMFRQMHEFLKQKGSAYDLDQNGAHVWRCGIEKGLGRFSVLFVAFDGDQSIAFAHGAMRLPHDFFQPQRIGFVTHVYVEPSYRSARVGEKLMQKLEEWFRAKGAIAMELNVLTNNTGAQRFYERLGYGADFVGMRKKIG